MAFFGHPICGGAPSPDIFRDQYVVEAQDLPYMFLTGDSRTGGEDVNRVMAMEEKERHPQSESALYQRHFDASGNASGHHQHNRTHDRIMVDAAKLVDRQLFERDGVQGKSLPLSPWNLLQRRLLHEEAGAGRRRPLCDEAIVLNMSQIPKETEIIFICVTSYTGQDFSRLSSVRLDVIDETHQQRIASFDVQHTTGNGTANLCACVTRVASPDPKTAGGPHVRLPPLHTHLWDLRELNVRTLGYTFVDVMPMALNAMGIPPHTHSDVMRNIPNYSLRKSQPQHLYSAATGNSGAVPQADYSRPHSSRSGARQEQVLSSAREMRGGEDNLCDLRFGVGWDGEHDVDAFLVMLDSAHRHVAHVHPKLSRTLSAEVRRQFACQHSGDCRSGVGHSGDAESMDILAYALPPEVHTVFVGITLEDSHSSTTSTGGSPLPTTAVGMAAVSSPFFQKPASSVVDVPGLYLRLQNRVLHHPYAVEVDRWDIYKERAAHERGVGHSMLSLCTSEKDAANKEGKEKEKEEQQSPGTAAETSLVAEAVAARTRTLLLGALVRSGEVPLQQLFPDGRSVSDALSLSPREASPQSREGCATPRATEDQGGSTLPAPLSERQRQLEERSGVPQFTYVPLRHLLPHDPSRSSFSGVIVYLESLGSLIDRLSSGKNSSIASASHRHRLTPSCSPRRRVPSTLAIREAIQREAWNEVFGLQLEFLQVVKMQPQLPDAFRCHGEAWVHGAGPELSWKQGNYICTTDFNRWRGSSDAFYKVKSGLVPPNLPFRTSYLTSPTALSWESGSSDKGVVNTAVFAVHAYDCVRVALYTRAGFGWADLRVSDHPDVLPCGVGRHHGQKGVGKELTLTLHTPSADTGRPIVEAGNGTHAAAVVRVRLSHLSLKQCVEQMRRGVEARGEAVKRHRRAQATQFNEKQRKAFSWCAPM